jgi:hypothetical protein
MELVQHDVQIVGTGISLVPPNYSNKLPIRVGHSGRAVYGTICLSQL